MTENNQMSGEKAYKLWRRAAGEWGDWVRVVPFVCEADNYFVQNTDEDINALCNQICKIAAADSAIILDIDGVTAIKAGAKLSTLGCNVVPLFNGTSPQNGTMATIDCDAISLALISYADKLEKKPSAHSTSTVFLLDSDRMHRHKMDASIFDNSYDMFPQDFPSPQFFKSRGITKIKIVGQKLNKDLKRILKPFRKKGIEICAFYNN